MSFFVSRVTIIFQNRFIFGHILKAADCILLTIWQVSNLLERLPELNSSIGGVGNKNWQIWKTQLCCFQSPLYFVGLRISSGRFLKVRQKRPRTNKYLRKRIHNLKFIFDFDSRASHNTYISSRVEQERDVVCGKKQLFTLTVKLRFQSCSHMFSFLLFFQVEMEYSACLWAFLSFAKEINLPRLLPELQPCQLRFHRIEETNTHI